MSDPRKERRAHLRVPCLHADRRARRVGNHRRHGEADRIRHRHAPAEQRVGLHRVGDVGGAPPPDPEGEKAEDEAQARRYRREAQHVDMRLRGEIASRREVEIERVQRIDRLAHREDAEAHRRAERRAKQDQPALMASEIAAEGGVAIKRPHATCGVRSARRVCR